MSVPAPATWGLFFADITGDGKADLLNQNKSNGDIYVHYNTGSGFTTYAQASYPGLTPTATNLRPLFADVNNDGRDDVLWVPGANR